MKNNSELDADAAVTLSINLRRFRKEDGGQDGRSSQMTERTNKNTRDVLAQKVVGVRLREPR